LILLRTVIVILIVFRIRMVKFVYISPGFKGPAVQGILVKQADNNAVLSAPSSMPAKFYPSDGGNDFAMGRAVYMRTLGGANYANPANVNSAYCQGGSKKWAGQYHDAELYTERKRNNAIGEASINRNGVPLAFRSNDETIRNTRLQRCRAGGCTAPPKKGALNSGFKSGGGSALTSSGGNRQIVVGSTIVPAFRNM
jgi:hypothetical protein